MERHQAAVAVVAAVATTGRKVGKSCVTQTTKNRHKPACTLVVTRGTLSFTGHAGTNTAAFQGPDLEIQEARARPLHTGHHGDERSEPAPHGPRPELHDRQMKRRYSA
jgi:hypothetical protein